MGLNWKDGYGVGGGKVEWDREWESQIFVILGC